MKISRILCILAIISGQALSSPPLSSRLMDTSGATRLRTVGKDMCEVVSDTIGRLLDLGQQYTDGRLPNYTNVLVNFDIFDPLERVRFVCQFKDLGSLSALLQTLDDNGMLDHLVRRVYNHIATACMIYKRQYLVWLDNIDQYSWLDEEDLQVPLDFIHTLEATGILQHDPEGTTEYLDARVYDSIEDKPPPLEAPSDQPLQAQVNQLTNALRMMWKHHVKEVSEWNPEYAEELRETIRNWTGLVVGSHDDMKSIVADVLGAAKYNGLQGIIEIVKDYDVPRHVFKQGYPLVLELMQNMVPGPVSNDVNNANEDDYEFQLENDLFILYLGTIGMGLQHLTDDL